MADWRLDNETRSDRNSWRRPDDRATERNKSYLSLESNEDIRFRRVLRSRRMTISGLAVCILATVVALVYWLSFRTLETPLILVQTVDVASGIGDQSASPYQQDHGLNEKAARFLAAVNAPNIQFRTMKFTPSKIGDRRHVELALGWNARSRDLKIVTFFIAATAIATKDIDDVFVVGQSGDPYRATAPLSRGQEYVPNWKAVSLSTMLKQIVSATPPRSKVLVFVELTQPPPIMECGRFRSPLPGRVRKVYEQLDSSVQRRLGIIMSCDDHQENWSAPELGRTAFSQFVAEALAGAADGHGERRKDSVITVREVASYVRDSVRDWTARYRHACQTPAFLRPDDKEFFSIKIAKTSGQLSDSAVTPQPRLTDVENRQQSLRQHWDDYHRYRNHFNGLKPLEVGVIEARLIRLEQLVERGNEFSVCEASWDLPSLHTQVEPIVTGSIYERYDLSPKLNRELVSWMENPPKFLFPSDDEREFAAVPTSLSYTEKVWLMWHWLLKASETNPNQFIQEPTLGRAVSFLRNSQPRDGRPAWQEHKLLDLLHREVDWNQRVSSSGKDAFSRSVGLLIQCRHHLQSAATHRTPEVHFWIRDDMEDLDATWRLAFDQILTGRVEQIKDAEEKLHDLLDRLDSSSGSAVKKPLTLTEKTATIGSAIELRNEAYRTLPHLLRYSVLQVRLENQSGKPDAEVEKRLMLIRDAFDLTTELAHELRDPDSTKIVDVGQKSKTLAILIENQKQAFHRFVREACQGSTDKVISTPKFRKARIALQSPLISKEERKCLHRLCCSFWSSYTHQPEKIGKQKLATDSAHPRSIDYSATLNDLAAKQNAMQSHWGRWLQHHWSYACGIEGSWQPDVYQSGLENHRSALKIENELRMSALLLGEYLTRGRKAEAARAIIANRQRLTAVEAKCWLASRCVQDMWGNSGDSSKEPYFVRLANAYIDGVPPLKLYRTTRVSTVNKIRSENERLLREMQVRWKQSTVGLDDRGQAPLTFSSPLTALTNAVPNHYLVGDGIRREFVVHSDASASRVRNFPLVLGQQSEPNRIVVDSRESELPISGAVTLESVTALRGNRVRQPIHLRVPAPPTAFRTVDFRRRKQQRVLLRVDSDVSAVLRVTLIVDGSGSTLLKTKSIENLESTVLDKLKLAAETEVLETLKTIHGTQQSRVMVRLVAFGLVPKSDDDELLGVKREKLMSRKRTVSTLVTTRFQEATSDNVARMVSLINRIESDGATPLYDAVSRGIELSNRLAAQKSVVIALTDGVDNTNHLGRKSYSSLKKLVRMGPASVHLLEIDNRAYYEKTGKLAEYSAGKQALEDLQENSNQHFHYLRTSDVKRLGEEIDKVVPRTRISVTQLENGADGAIVVPERPLDGRTIDLSRVEFPARVSVRITSPLGESTERVLDLSGDRSFHLVYKGPNRLLYSQPPAGNNPTRGVEFQDWRAVPQGPSWLVGLEKPTVNIGESGNSVRFNLAMQPRSKEPTGVRPRFILAEVRKLQKGEPDEVFDVYDHEWRPYPNHHLGEYHPVVSLAELPWFEQARHRPRTNAKLRVWIAPERPAAFAKLEVLANGDSQTRQIGSDVVSAKCNDGTLQVTIRSSKQGKSVERWGVHTPKFRRVQRSYAEDGTVVQHFFHLPTDVVEQVVIEFTDLDAIKEVLGDPLEFDPLTLAKE